MSTTFNIKQGDYHRRLALDLTDITTTGATGVTFRFRDRDGGTVMAPTGTIVTATQVAATFAPPQLDTPGVYLLEAVLAFADGTETVPTSGYVTVSVEPKLT